MKGSGTQYVNPGNPHDRVRVMPENPNSSNPAQRSPYVKREIDGKYYDVKGQIVPGDSLLTDVQRSLGIKLMQNMNGYADSIDYMADSQKVFEDPRRDEVRRVARDILAAF